MSYPEDRRVILNFDKVAVQQMLPSGLSRVDMQVVEDQVHDMMIARLSAYVLSERLAEDTVTDTRRVPATWRDHAKQALTRWVGRQRSAIDRKPFVWWLARHPVQYRTITFSATWTRRATRPESTLRTPDLGPVVYQETVSHRFWEDAE